MLASPKTRVMPLTRMNSLKSRARAPKAVSLLLTYIKGSCKLHIIRLLIVSIVGSDLVVALQPTAPDDAASSQCSIVEEGSWAQGDSIRRADTLQGETTR